MADYKFLHTRDVNHVLVDGTVRLSGLAHYRQMEGQQWIADRLEGRSEVKVEHWKYSPHEAPSFAPAGESAPIYADASSTVVVENSVFEYRLPDPEPFMFCAARGELQTLALTMCEGADRYDACLRIDDLYRLAHRMFYRGLVLEFEGARTYRVFRDFQVTSVSYDNHSRNQEQRLPPPPSPFRKHAVFSSQSEVRIAFCRLHQLRWKHSL
jgi:hypothetical protein